MIFAGMQEAADHMAHPHHWYQWVKDWIIPIVIGLATGVGIVIKLCRKGRR